MSLTREDWVKLLVPAIVSAGILATLGQFFIREWYQPYVHYGTGGAYMSPQLAISSLGLVNMGHSDAENITITASFVDPLTDISTGKLATPFDISAGGAGQKVVTGTIKRLVPDEVVNLYFITEPSLPWGDYSQFIRDIKFNGGKGTTGTPWVLTILAYLIAAVIVGVVFGALHFLVFRGSHKVFNDRLREAVQLGVFARQEGISAEELNTKVEKFHQTISVWKKPSKDTLVTCAQAAFEGTKQNPA